MKKVFLICGLVTLILSCSTRLVDFTIISTKNIDLTKGASFHRDKSRVVGKDMVHIVYIPLGQPSMKEAIDNAIEKIPGCIALLDGVVYSKFWYVVYGQMYYLIEGTPLIDPSLVLNNNFEFPEYSSIQVNFEGKTELKQISENEYLAYKVRMLRNGMPNNSNEASDL